MLILTQQSVSATVMLLITYRTHWTLHRVPNTASAAFTLNKRRFCLLTVTRVIAALVIITYRHKIESSTSSTAKLPSPEDVTDRPLAEIYSFWMSNQINHKVCKKNSLYQQSSNCRHYTNYWNGTPLQRTCRHINPLKCMLIVSTQILRSLCRYFFVKWRGCTSGWIRAVRCTIRYDTRCYFNVRSKADISQLNLPHGTDN